VEPAKGLPESARESLDAVVAGRPLRLELALNEAARFRGLSGRRELAQDGGMLFVFPEAEPRAFVMRDCLIPIDIAFLSESGEVVAWHEMQVEPAQTPEWRLKRYASGRPARWAIELRGGSLRAWGLKAGDRVRLPASLKPRAS
jgi:uncharacterized membrane protein (UPF0127 family)